MILRDTDEILVNRGAVNHKSRPGIPVGTDAQRPANPTDGLVRFNTDNKRIEHYEGGAWRLSVREEDMRRSIVIPYLFKTDGEIAGDLPEGRGVLASSLPLLYGNIPAGYTNLLVTATVQFLCAAATFNQIEHTAVLSIAWGYNPAPSAENAISYQAVVWGNKAEHQGCGGVCTAIGSAVSVDPNRPTSVTMFGHKSAGAGRIQAYQGSLSVLAYSV